MDFVKYFPIIALILNLLAYESCEYEIMKVHLIKESIIHKFFYVR